MRRKQHLVLLRLWTRWFLLPRGPLTAHAAEIRLVNGDRLTGTPPRGAGQERDDRRATMDLRDKV